MTQTIIDVWMQHPTDRFLAQPFLDSLKRWSRNTIPDSVTLEMTVAAMDQAGVSKGLIAAWHGPTGELISNEEVAGFVNRYPERFVGIASANLYKPMEAVRELRHYVKNHNFKGLRVVPWLWSLPPDDRRYYPLYAECVELDIPFCTQIGHTGPLLPSEPGRPIPYLENVALEFPELKIIGGHLGAPWVSEVVSMAHKFPNFYIDTSAYKASRFPPDFVHFLKNGGARKVMFGSNFPMITAADCLAELASLGLTDADTEAFLSGNAKKVFGL